MRGSRRRGSGPAFLFLVAVGCALPACQRAVGDTPSCPEPAAKLRAAPRPVRRADARPPVAQDRPPAILRFDCEKAHELALDGCGDAVTPFSTGLRGYELGGPEGVAWNATYLHCMARLSTPCPGPAQVELLVGNRVLRRLPVDVGSGRECSFGLEREEWQSELDTDRDLLYRTAIFRLELTQDCGDPPHPVRARDAFVAGLAEGE